MTIMHGLVRYTILANSITMSAIIFPVPTGIDYELLLGEYTIHPNQSNVTIPITVVDDVIAEDAESFSVILLLPQSRSIPITIADNDSE